MQTANLSMTNSLSGTGQIPFSVLQGANNPNNTQQVTP